MLRGLCLQKPPSYMIFDMVCTFLGFYMTNHIQHSKNIAVYWKTIEQNFHLWIRKKRVKEKERIDGMRKHQCHQWILNQEAPCLILKI